ncbi:ABC transporter permease [Amycolatopsis albispora]|uniref:ABC transporter permease n=1 Tax=Amycolatopsis albispora TaxID=1804986 RepID=UPI001965873C|nr:ABC transporter permease [Amycolatopsis albispora]
MAGLLTRFVARRLAALFVTLLAASVVIYGALHLGPGDPAALLAGGRSPDPEVLAAVRAQYHLDDPFWTRYGRWLSDVAGWRLGRSMTFGTDVAGLISARLGNTLFLVGYAAVLILVIGIGFGLLGALGGRVGATITTVSSGVLMAVPAFIAAIVLIWLFATRLNWLPVFGSGTGFTGRIEHLTLPALALAGSYIAYLSRITRSAVATELRSERVETARSRGVRMPAIVRRHVLRNAAAPVLTVSGLTVAGLIAGTVVVEQAFGVSGVGSLLVLAAQKQDFVVVQNISLLMVAAFCVANTLVDVLNAVLDKRLLRTGR